MSFLEIKDIKKRYKSKNILSGVSFGIEEREIFGLIGNSGCGKSTFLKILIGMINADSGKIFIDGKNAMVKKNYLKKNTGFATQENMLFDELTIKENSFYFGKLYGLRRRQIKEKLNELLVMLRLEEYRNTQINKLSGGMIKRANLLVSLIHNPRLLILDEPTAGLDPILRSSLWEYIKQINSAGTTILVTSHLLEEIEKNCNKIAILKKGEVIAIGSPRAYKEKYGAKLSFNEIFEAIIQNENI